MNWCHEKIVLDRPSTLKKHEGINNTVVKINQITRILGVRRVLEILKINCNTCRKQNGVTLDQPTGKVREEMLRKPSDHHHSVMIDLIPSIKVSSFSGEKQGARSKKDSIITTHILLAICLTTKFITYTLLNDRTQQALISGLNSIFSKIGRTPTTLYTDRESGIIPLSKSNKLSIHEKGMVLDKRMIIKFCPSTGPGHQFHGLVEARVKSVKNNFGSLTANNMDCVTLGHFLDRAIAGINSLPLFTRIRPDFKADLSQAELIKMVSPQDLCRPQGNCGIIYNEAAKDLTNIQEKEVESIDKIMWNFLTLMARYTEGIDKEGQIIATSWG